MSTNNMSKDDVAKYIQLLSASLNPSVMLDFLEIQFSQDELDEMRNTAVRMVQHRREIDASMAALRAKDKSEGTRKVQELFVVIGSDYEPGTGNKSEHIVAICSTRALALTAADLRAADVVFRPYIANTIKLDHYKDQPLPMVSVSERSS
jgi:hypothetical protein